MDGNATGQANGAPGLVPCDKFQHLVDMGFLKPTGVSLHLEVGATHQMSLKSRMEFIQIRKAKVDVPAVLSGQIPPYTRDFPIEII